MCGRSCGFPRQRPTRCFVNRSNNNTTADLDKELPSFLFSITSSDLCGKKTNGEFHCHQFGEKVVLRKGKDGQALVLNPRSKGCQSLICSKHYQTKCCKLPVIVDHPITKEKMIAALKKFNSRCAYKKGYALPGDEGYDDAMEKRRKQMELSLETRRKNKEEKEKRIANRNSSETSDDLGLQDQSLDNSSDDSQIQPPVVDTPPLAQLFNVPGNIQTQPPVLPQVVALAQPTDIPGNIQTQPAKKLVFNAPFRSKHTNPVEISNISAHRIAWAVRSTNTDRLSVDPAYGVLDPNETILVTVSCEAFDYDQNNVYNDRIVIEWSNTPNGAAKNFSSEWLESDGLVRRKNMIIEYNA